MRADKRDPVIAALRRFKPTAFAVKVGDDSKSLALSTKANKWELLLDTLNTWRWTHIEALDDKGNVLGAIDREAEDEDEDEFVDVEVDRVDKLTAIMMRVQQNTMLECRRMTADQTKVFGDMAASMMEAMRVMQDSYQTAIRMTATAAAASVTSEDGGQDAVMKMVQMAIALKTGSPMPSMPPRPAPPQRPRPQPTPRPNPAKSNGATAPAIAGASQ